MHLFELEHGFLVKSCSSVAVTTLLQLPSRDVFLCCDRDAGRALGRQPRAYGCKTGTGQGPGPAPAPGDISTGDGTSAQCTPPPQNGYRAIGSRSHIWHEFGSSQPGVPPAKDHHAEGTPLLSSAVAALGVHVGTHPAPHRTACYSPQVCCQLMELVPGELPRSLGERRVNEAPATAAGTSTRGTGTGTGRGWMDGRLGGAGCRVSSSVRFG